MQTKNVPITIKDEHINQSTSNGDELIINANDNTCYIGSSLKISSPGTHCDI